MASIAEPVRIGPFTGGLNTYADASTIGDTECAEINNFDIDLDGTLVSRPPVTMVPSVNTLGTTILGYFTWTDGVIYIIVSTSGGTYAYNTTTLAWTTITTTIASKSMVQYANKAWLVSVPVETDPGGSWDPVSGFTAVASMAHGHTCCVYKERMFIGSGNDHANPSRLYYSPVANFGGVWIDFVDVSNGDGQDIVEIISYNGAIVVLKQNSTFMFAYDSSVSKGAVQVISSTIGIAAKNCVSVHENILYVMYSGDVFAVNNWNWEQLNVKVPFTYVNAHLATSNVNYSISVIGNRLVCKYFDTYYVYGLKTKAWTKWTFTADAQLLPNKFWKFPNNNPTTGIDVYYSGSSLSTVVTAKGFMVFKDTYNGVDSELMNVSVRSKTYNFNVPYSYKRLFWWGIDLLSNSDINAKLIPVAYGRPITWNQVAHLTWDDIAEATWNQPLDIPLDVTDSAEIHNTSGVRMFIKFLKSIRFRQLSFELTSVVNGTTTTGPLRLFTITAFVANKQLSNKKIN